ncbi:MAG TPA: hypothetical protein VGM64_02215 [Lacunisphaera sp.]|jgi:hypothetical protein
MQTTSRLNSHWSDSIRRYFKQHVRALAMAAAVIVFPAYIHAQGCVTAHGCGLLGDLMEQSASDDHWDASVSYRWFKSDRHYVGTAYQAQRDAAGDQVINTNNYVDFAVNYAVSPRYSVALTVPFVANNRSQVVKDSNGVILDRFSTQAAGLSDISVVGGAWVFDPAKSPKGNIQINLGAVLPTGNFEVQDTFETYDKASGKIVAVQKPVDNSIQPGLGGYGILVGFSSYYQLGAGFSLYGDASYTITPQEVNRVGNSIGDSYIGRGGFEYSFKDMGATMKGVSASLGLRAEGVAVYDLIGGSLGSRRPGYSVAVDPGITIARKNWSFRFYVPVAIQRDRLQSYLDKLKTWSTGKYTQGDAAFANYLIQWSFSCKF